MYFQHNLQIQCEVPRCFWTQWQVFTSRCYSDGSVNPYHWRFSSDVRLKMQRGITPLSHTFIITKPTRCTNFSNLFLKWNSTCFGQFFYPSGVFDCTHSNCVSQQTCMTYTIAVCTVNNSWWCTEELSETCKVSFQEQIWEISASSCFYYTYLLTYSMGQSPSWEANQ